ncbi:MAG: hypothetical protein CMJ18_24940 [Phycisphaeraceae bacterium]|nr:hypothetical protein [Phycisphaeraceae bacterium]
MAAHAQDEPDADHEERGKDYELEHGEAPAMAIGELLKLIASGPTLLLEIAPDGGLLVFE